MRYRLKFCAVTLCLGCAFPSATQAEDKVDFFRRFLDQSPNATETRSSNLAQEWLNDVARSAPPRVLTEEEEMGRQIRHVNGDDWVPEVQQPAIRMAARPLRTVMSQPKPPAPTNVAEPVTSSAPTPAPIVPPPVSTAVPTTAPSYDTPAAVVRPAVVMPAINTEQPQGPNFGAPIQDPAPPVAAPAPTSNSAIDPANSVQGANRENNATSEPEVVSEEVRRIEAGVVQRVDSLQRQLEQEEKNLEKRLVSFARQREAALQKNDETSLQKIEKAEQAVVAGYDQRVQRILRAALPETGNVNAGARRAVAEQRVAPSPRGRQPASRTPNSYSRNRQPVQKPVAGRLPSGSQKLPPSWTQQRKPRVSSPNGQRATSTGQRSGSPQRPAGNYRVPSKAQRPPGGTVPAKNQEQPAKKKFRLWPFR